MLVWDTSLNRFAEFGSNQEIGISHNFGFCTCMIFISASSLHMQAYWNTKMYKYCYILAPLQLRQQGMDLIVIDRFSFCHSTFAKFKLKLGAFYISSNFCFSLGAAMLYPFVLTSL